MLAVETTKLSKTYKVLGKAPVHSLIDLDLQIREKEIFGFLGRNGAGKTTTIKLLTGLIFPTHGSAKIFGQDIGQSEVRRLVGYMPEQPYFYEYLTPRETLDFYGKLRGLGRLERKQEWEKISELLELKHIADRRIRGFSKGMRQRVGFAVALVGDPPLLILDEPMSGLDPLGRRMIRELIKRLHRNGKTIFFSSHVLSDVEEICDRVGILVSGKLAACGSIDELVGRRPKSVEIVAENLSKQFIEAIQNSAQTAFDESDGRYGFVLPDVAAGNAFVKSIHADGGTVISMYPIIESLEDFFTRIQQDAMVYPLTHRDGTHGKEEE